MCCMPKSLHRGWKRTAFLSTVFIQVFLVALFVFGRIFVRIPFQVLLTHQQAGILKRSIGTWGPWHQSLRQCSRHHFRELKQRRWLCHTEICFMMLKYACYRLYCCLEESIASDSGKYYDGCKEKPVGLQAKETGAQSRLWKMSEELVGLNAKWISVLC